MQVSQPETSAPAEPPAAPAAGPADPPQAPMTLGVDLLDQAVRDYDRASHGKWQEHLAALRQRGDPHAWSPRYPLAWAIARMSARVREPGFAFYGDPDAAACVHLAAFREFLACWSHVARFPDLCVSAAADGFSLHALALFAAAQHLAKSGNPGAFIGPDATGRIRALLIGDGKPGSLTVVAQPLPADLQWPVLKPATLGTLQFAVQDALAAAQGAVNARRPGIVVLSGGVASSEIDPPLLDAIETVLRKHGRRHRGVAAVVAMIPKLPPTDQLNRPGFRWAFYPLANPHHQGEYAVHIGARPKGPGAAPPQPAAH
jgi:hypothetical protein